MRRALLVLTLAAGVNIAFAQNIGIGTPTPDYNLDVSGTVGIDDHIYHNEDPDTWMSFPSNDQWEVVTGNQKMLLADSSRFIINPDTFNIEMVILADGVDHLFSANTQDRLIGVGTAAPVYLFDISGDFRVMGDAVDHLIFADASTGRVGIGTSNPNHLMDVDGTFRVKGNGSNNLFKVDATSNRVGIGTGSPNYRLDISGDFRVRGSSNNHLFYIDSNNDLIGFGTNNPQSMLDVAGMVSADNLRVAGNDLDFLNNLAEGTETISTDSPTGAAVLFPVSWPTFGSTPNISITITNQTGSGNEIYVHSIKNLGNGGCTVIVQRLDGLPWTNDLKLDYIAWE